MEDLPPYGNGGFYQVEGWTQPGAFEAVKVISQLQSAAGLVGGAAEIGVHHGRFFIGLHNSCSLGTKSLAIDVFDNQSDNIDDSGAGDASVFETNLKRFCPGAADVDIWSRDSLSLNTADIQRCLDKYGPFAMFSIDGGHTVEHTSNDLKFAEAVTASFGVIFVDDYYNSHWPGVHIGVARHYTLSSPRFVPFAYVRDKLLLTSLTWHSRYLRMFQENAANWQDVKMVNMFGYRVISFNFVL